MAIHQKYHGLARNLTVNLPPDASGNLHVRAGGLVNLKFNMPKDSKMAMLFSNGKRVNINERS